MKSDICKQKTAEVLIAGEMDELVRGAAERLVERIAPVLRRHSLILDLSFIKRIDAAGIRSLLSLHRIARNAGHSFAVSNASQHVQRALAAVGLDRIFASCDNLAGTSIPTAAKPVSIAERGGLHAGSTSASLWVAESATRGCGQSIADSNRRLAGCCIIDVPDLETAIWWAARSPAVKIGAVEVRPLWAAA
ncbi:MAG: STAS domain-containing protein [Terracidiphilus sp.]